MFLYKKIWPTIINFSQTSNSGVCFVLFFFLWRMKRRGTMLTMRKYKIYLPSAKNVKKKVLCRFIAVCSSIPSIMPV